MELKRPFLLFLGDAADDLTVKTAAGIVDWRKSWCVGQWRLSECKADVHLDDMSPSDAKAQGAETMIVGVANAGGILKESWISSIVEALEAGLDVASGLHVKLEAFPAIGAAAKRTGRSLHNVRIPDRTFLTGMGTKRRGRRLLTVGTDCCVGKKYTALSLEAAMRAKGWMLTSAPLVKPAYSFPGAGLPSTQCWPISSRAPQSGSAPRRKRKAIGMLSRARVPSYIRASLASLLASCMDRSPTYSWSVTNRRARPCVGCRHRYQPSAMSST